MSLNSSKTANTKSSTGGFSMPEMPSYTQGPVQNYFSNMQGVGEKLNTPGVLEQNPNWLQQQAATGAGNLGGWNGLLGQSSKMALSAANPTLATATGYNPASLGKAATYQAPSLGSAQTTTATGYNPTLAAATTIADNERATASHAAASSLLDGGLDRYLNPLLGGVVDTTLASFDDNSGRVRAQQAAQAAKSRAFGGSRSAILEAQTERDLALARAGTEAGLRSDAWSAAAGLAGNDADRRQNVSLFNAGADNSTSQFNAGQTNNRNIAQGQLGQQLNLANAGFTNDASAFGAKAQNDASMFNARENNSFASQQAQLAADAARYGAEANNNFGLAQFGAQNEANEFNAGALNRNSEFNTNLMQSGLLSGAELLSNNANAMGGNAREDIASQGNIGNMLWDIGRQNQLAPFTAKQLEAELLGAGGLLGNITGQSTTGWGNEIAKQTSNGGLLGTLASIASIASAVAPSDRRLKLNITQVGAMADGLGVYDFDYVWGGPRQRGVMADEVAALRPWALGPEVGGFATVDYAAL